MSKFYKRIQKEKDLSSYGGLEHIILMKFQQQTSNSTQIKEYSLNMMWVHVILSLQSASNAMRKQ